VGKPESTINSTGRTYESGKFWESKIKLEVSSGGEKKPVLMLLRRDTERH